MLTSCVARTGEDAHGVRLEAGHGAYVAGLQEGEGHGRRRQAVEAELKRFEGTWRFESLVVEGKVVPPEGLKTTRLTLKGDTFVMTDPMATYKGTFTLDLGVKPKRIDMAFTEGPEAGKTVQAIYELDGDTYKVCVGLAGRGRPERFASEPGSGHALEVLRREKP